MVLSFRVLVVCSATLRASLAKEPPQVAKIACQDSFTMALHVWPVVAIA
jgi:hypothetical protein